jgi:hypothetical protein
MRRNRPSSTTPAHAARLGRASTGERAATNWVARPSDGVPGPSSPCPGWDAGLWWRRARGPSLAVMPLIARHRRAECLGAAPLGGGPSAGREVADRGRTGRRTGRFTRRPAGLTRRRAGRLTRGWRRRRRRWAWRRRCDLRRRGRLGRLGPPAGLPLLPPGDNPLLGVARLRRPLLSPRFLPALRSAVLPACASPLRRYLGLRGVGSVLLGRALERGERQLSPRLRPRRRRGDRLARSQHGGDHPGHQQSGERVAEQREKLARLEWRVPPMPAPARTRARGGGRARPRLARGVRRAIRANRCVRHGGRARVGAVVPALVRRQASPCARNEDRA